MRSGVSVSEPDGQDHSAALGEDAMRWTGGDDGPRDFRTKPVEGRGDFLGGGEGETFIGALGDEAAGVVDAVGEKNVAFGIDEGGRAVGGLLGFSAPPFCGVAFDAVAVVGDEARGFPCFASVDGSPRVDLDLSPVGGVIATRLAVGEEGAGRGSDDSRDTVCIDSVETCMEQGGLGDGQLSFWGFWGRAR